jgi:hypothetical protein
MPNSASASSNSSSTLASHRREKSAKVPHVIITRGYDRGLLKASKGAQAMKLIAAIITVLQ